MKLLYVLNLIAELHLVDILGIVDLLPVTVQEDNAAAIVLSSTIITGKRLKHMDLKYHIINEKVASGVIVLNKVNTEVQLADLFTKPTCRAISTAVRPSPVSPTRG